MPIPDSIEIKTDLAARLVCIRFAPKTSLTSAHGQAMVDALVEARAGSDGMFGMIADAGGVVGTDADYRAVTGNFFSAHRKTARIALLNLGPIIRVVAEMFRVGTGVQMRTFPDEDAARAWLRKEGITA